MAINYNSKNESEKAKSKERCKIFKTNKEIIKKKTNEKDKNIAKERIDLINIYIYI